MRPIIDHIHITVEDIDRAEQYYDALLPFLGFDIAHKEHDAVPEREYRITEYHSSALSIGLVSQREVFSAEKPSRRKAGALHHVAFRVNSKEEVNELFEHIASIPSVVVREPQYYPEYCADYYAFFFKDSEGNELEILTFNRSKYFT